MQERGAARPTTLEPATRPPTRGSVAVMQSEARDRAIEAAGWYALAFWITTVLHEGAHFVAGLVVGRGPILHTTFVDYAHEGSVGDQVATALAGPLFSGISGALILLALRARRVPDATRPLVTWLGYHGLVNLVGYVFSVSFATGGDLGRVAALLELPTWLRIAITIAGFGLLRLVARPFGEVFAADAPSLDDEAAARAHARRCVMVPAWIATPLLIVAALPVPHWLALVYTLAAPLPLFDLPDALAKARSTDRSERAPALPAWSALVAFVLFVIATRLVLDRGVGMG